MTVAWIGASLDARELTIPDYGAWSRRDLLTHVRNLDDDFFDALNLILLKPKRSELDRLAKWFADAFQLWQQSGGGLIVLCTAHEFEAQCGPLRARDSIEVPPYAEILVQGWHGVAYRHPEYMLARDLAFLISLFRESEQLLAGVDWRRPPVWAKYGSENAQALARTVIQTCFNLVESFVSGLARAYIMTADHLDEHTKARLLENRSALKNRIASVPTIITGGDCGLRDDKPPLSILFGPAKQRRDAFVHCEPGPEPSSRGYVKEAAFHDVAPQVVEEAVSATSDIIKILWKAVHNADGPRWLPDFTKGPTELRALRLAKP
jgi:hypothetical protein